MMQKRKIKLYLLLVFILFVFVLYFSLKDNYMDIINTLANVKFFYLILGILFVYMSKFLIGLIVYLIAKKDKKNISLKTMLHIEIIYPFFAGITPGSLGGESFEIFYMKSGAGLSLGKASNVVMQKYILYLISLILSLLTMCAFKIYNKIKRSKENTPQTVSENQQSL